MKKVNVTVLYWMGTGVTNKRHLSVSPTATSRSILKACWPDGEPFSVLKFDHVVFRRKRQLHDGDIIEFYRLEGIGIPRFDRRMELLPVQQ